MKKPANGKTTKVIKKNFSISDVGVLMEDFDKQLGLMAEGIVSLDQKLDRTAVRLENRIDSLDGKVDSLDKKVDSLGQRVDSLDKKVDSLDQKIDRVAAELKEFVRSEIGILRVEIKSIDKEKATLAEMEKLEERVSALERLVGKRTRI